MKEPLIRNIAPLITTIWMAASLLILFSWHHVDDLEQQGLNLALSSQEQDLRNLTFVAEEHARRTIETADQWLRLVQARYLDHGPLLDLQQLAATGMIDPQIFIQIGVINDRGILIASTLSRFKKVDLSDRKHFLVHIAADSNATFISEPVLGRASGVWAIQLTRRITLKDGSFGGVAVLSMNPDYFTHFYSQLVQGKKGMEAIYGFDGVARARVLGTAVDFGANVQKSKVFSLINGGKMEGSFIEHSVVDGVERLYYYRAIKGFPLLMISGEAVDKILDDHILANNALNLQALLLSALIVIIAGMVHYHLVRVRNWVKSRDEVMLETQIRKAHLEAIFSMSPDGFVSFDEQHRISFVSRSFKKMVAGNEVDSLEKMHEDDFAYWFASCCIPGVSYRGHMKTVFEDEHSPILNYHQVEFPRCKRRVLQVASLRNASGPVPLLMYFRDVTHESEVERMKSDFLTTAAHELRTPMSSIYGYTEILISDGGLSEIQADYLNIIYKQSEIITHILDELLDLARIEARQGSDFRYSCVELQGLLRSAVGLFEPVPSRAPPVLKLPSVPVIVDADEDKLHQVMMNLLSNAYKFSPNGGDVEVELELVMVDGTATACIHVSDRGMGLTAEQVEKVFVRFYRADASGKISGAGLGLSIVKEIVELHAGHLSVKSKVGEGTRISVFLPTAHLQVHPS